MDPRTEHGSELAAELLAEHRTVEKLIEQMMAAVDTAERSALQDAWDEFERQLLAHMDWEEANLLTEFGEFDPIAANRVLDEHAEFRARMTELGVRIDLRSARREDFQALLDELQIHAHFEDTTLYRWLSHTVDERRRASLLERLRAVIRSRAVLRPGLRFSTSADAGGLSHS